MTNEQARIEINIRIERETAYILALSEAISKGLPESIKLLNEKIESNDKIIKTIGMYLKNKGDDWETFYESNCD